jgi:hypothetical protein
MANKSPPIPFIIGATTPMTALAAMAASTALPPALRMSSAARVAAGWEVAAMPCSATETDRPGIMKSRMFRNVGLSEFVRGGTALMRARASRAVSTDVESALFCVMPHFDGEPDPPHRKML